jgi:RNA polymerase sigma factor (sigma-70 family)
VTRDDADPAGRDRAEAILISRIAAGDRGEPLGDLYDSYAKPFYAYGRRWLRDEELAEDLVLEFFQNLCRGARAFDPARASARRFMFDMLRSTSLGRPRRGRGGMLPFAAEDADEDGDEDGDGGGEPQPAAPDDPLAAAERTLASRDAFESLGEEAREILRPALAGTAQREIAAQLGIPLSTVQRHVSRAVRTWLAGARARGFDG